MVLKARLKMSNVEAGQKKMTGWYQPVIFLNLLAMVF